jgi:prephenate dehydrogenase
MRWRKVTLLGVGLLGGSLGMALRKRGYAERVCGFVRRKISVREAVTAGAVDSASTDLAECVAGADLIVLCTPLAQMSGLARAALPQVEPRALVTDVGSVKGPLVRELDPLFASRGAVFVGSHPMAGSEKMGVAAARADLFQNAVCVVTPSGTGREAEIGQIEELWRSVGARTMRLGPEEHDELVARSSHLPHVLAAHLASYVLDPAHAREQAQLCANGFRDSTRIASGSPEMWRDIVVMNKEPIRRALREYRDLLEAFDKSLQDGSGLAVEGFFQKAKALRDAWSAKCASASPE